MRKAFKVAQTEKPGAAFIDFPENVAEMKTDKEPIKVQTPYSSIPPAEKIEAAAKLISNAKAPVILAGNGVIRQGAADSLVTFAEVLRIPVANSFMAKGVMPFTNELSLGTIGLKAIDLPWYAFDGADVIICVGYDMVEYHPDMWNPKKDKIIIHIDAPARRSGRALRRRRGRAGRHPRVAARGRALREAAEEFAVQGRAQGDHRRPRRIRERHRLSDQAAEDRVGPCAKCSAPTTSRSPTSARTRCG